jgi:hypothetical protein
MESTFGSDLAICIGRRADKSDAQGHKGRLGEKGADAG